MQAAAVCSSSLTNTHCSTDRSTLIRSQTELSSYRSNGSRDLTEAEEETMANRSIQSNGNWTRSTAVNSNTFSRRESSSFLLSQTGSMRTRRETRSTFSESSPGFKFSVPSLRRLYVHRRFPCNKKIWLVYTMFFLQGIGEYSSSIFLFFVFDAYNPLNPPKSVAAYLLTRSAIFMAYPVKGFLADTFFGRYRVIKASLYISLLGAVILAIGFSTSNIDPWLRHHEVSQYERFDFSGEKSWSKEALIFLGIVYALMSIGFTGIQVNLIPFGVDQLDEASSGELSSYFHWYFWWYNAGALVGLSTVPYIYRHYSLGVFFLLLAVCFTLEILILILHRDTEFIIQSHIGNPLKLVYQVLKSSLRAKKPAFTSAFDVGRPPPSRIDLTMRINGGKYTVEQVEDVKTFFRILLILVSFFGYFAVSPQLLTTYILEAIRMTVPPGTFENCTARLQSSTTFFEGLNTTHQIECQLWNIPPSLWMGLTNIVPTLIMIPLVDRIFYVCFRPSMLKRMAVGKVFLFVSLAVAIVVETARAHSLWNHFKTEGSTIVINAIPFHTASTTTFHTASPLSIFWIAPQYSLFVFAEVLGNITAVEFIYAQSPAAMKGLLLGMLFLTSGLAMGLSAAFIYLQSFAHQLHFASFFGNSNEYIKDIFQCLRKKHEFLHDCTDGPLFSYILLAVVVLFSVAVFVSATVKYKFRKRDVEPYNPNFMFT